MNIRSCVACALCVGAAIQLLAPSARAQVDPPTAPTSAEIWARYRECEPRLKPVDQDEFQRLSAEERPAFLDAHCSGQQEEEASAPEPEPTKIVAVAHFEDRDGALNDDAILVTLDTTLWSTFAGRKQSRFELVRLDPLPAGCGRKCALEAAKTAGAAFLVRGDAQRVADKLLATIEILSVQTSTVMQTHRSKFVFEPAFLVESTAEAVSRAASNLFADPVAASGQKVPAGSKPIIAIARLQSGASGVDEAVRGSLDDSLWYDVSSQPNSSFRFGRLTNTESRCDLVCAVAAAKAADAMYVLWTSIERQGAQLRIWGALASVNSGWTLHKGSSGWAIDADQLRIGLPKLELDTVFKLSLSKRSSGWNQSTKITSGFGGTKAATPLSAEEQRKRVFSSPSYQSAIEARSAGILLFVLGIVVDGGGSALLAGGIELGNTGVIVVGAGLEVVGTIMFFSGLGIWVSNHIRMNKIERGIPLGRSFRLEGLSPIVASRDAGAPGLSARFSF